MAIIGEMDLGIGDTVPSAYVRIAGFTYNPESKLYKEDGSFTLVPEVEIEIHSYYNKAARQLHILKLFVSNYMDRSKLTDKQNLWLQNNILTKSVYPLQTLKWATRNLSMFSGIDLSIVSPAVAIPYFYTWIKDHPVMGVVLSPQDDMDSASGIVSSFKIQHPEFFGG